MSRAPDAGRVIAGTARGLRLGAPGEGTRPLGDRVKQTLFAILEPELRGARFLDLFAGSGAAGIEALSRGAIEATFVERDRSAARVIQANLERTGLAANGRVVVAEALAWLTRQAAADTPAAAGEPPFDVVFVDPPYDEPATLESAVQLAGEIVRPNGRVVAKHHWRTRLPGQLGLLASERDRRFGETALTFFRRSEER